MQPQNPNDVSPQWVRETLCEDLAEMDRSAGRIPDTRTIEQVVDGDIRSFEGQERDKKKVDNKARKAAEMAAKEEERRALAAENRAMGLTNDGLDKNDPAGDLAKKMGYKLIRVPVAPQPKVSRRATCECGGWKCKTCKLYARIQELLKPEAASRPREQKYHYKVPGGHGMTYARMILDESLRRGQMRGEYRGQDALVCDAILRRRIEDIADRSNAHPGLGNWHHN